MTIQPMNGRERTNACTAITKSRLGSNVLIVTRISSRMRSLNLKTVARGVNLALPAPTSTLRKSRFANRRARLHGQ